jgi:hypothetical protein
VWWKLKAIGPPLLLVKKMQPRRTADFVRNKTKITLLFASPFPSIWNNIMTKLMNVLLYLHIRIAAVSCAAVVCYLESQEHRQRIVL